MKKSFILLAWVMLSSLAYAQKQSLQFKHFSSAQGLSDLTMSCITEDSQGFLWFGSTDGLNKFDGYRFTTYRHDPKVKGSLSHNTVWALHTDRQGRVWVGTDDGGVNVYDRVKDAFVSYQHDPANPKSLSANEVTSIFQDSHNRLWVGTDGGGLNLLDEKTGTFTRFLNDPANPNSLSYNVIRSMCEDRHGNLCLATDGGGVEMMNFETKSFAHHRFNAEDSTSVSANHTHEVYRDRKGNLWVGTVGGLCRYDEAHDNFIRYPWGETGVVSSFIKSIKEDAEGNIWIGSITGRKFVRGGLSLLRKGDKTITQYKYDPNKLDGLSSSEISDVWIDKADNIWLATINGISIKEGGKRKFFQYKMDVLDSTSLHSNDVIAFTQDRQNQVWVITGPGLEKFDKRKGTFELHTLYDQTGQIIKPTILTFFEDPTDGTHWLGSTMGLLHVDKNFRVMESFMHMDVIPSISHAIELITADKKGNLILSARQVGLFVFNKAQKQFIPVPQKEKEPALNRDIFSLFVDADNNIWVGTALFGLYKLNLRKGTTQRFHKNDQSGLSDNFIFYMMEDSKKRLWLGTKGGINLMDRKTNTFTNYRQGDGLPNDIVFGLLEDSRGHLWASTNNGLSHFDPEHKTFKNYTVEDGLQGNQFRERCYYKGRDGDMYFGGLKGFNVFNPLKVADNPTIPPVYITAFQIFNKPVLTAGEDNQDSPLKKNILDTKEITLSYKESVFSFEFAALNYVVSSKNQYAYKMEGFDKDWNLVGSKRTATYTNLDPGEYTFRVKASNNDGVWNEQGTAIQVTITPPFWQTWWFRTLVVITVLSSAFTFYRVRINALKAQQAKLEKQVKERTAEVNMQKEELEAQAEHLKSVNGELTERHEEILQQQEELQSQAETLQITNIELKEKQEEIQTQRDRLQQVNEQVMSSIQYAQTIQRAILPSQKKIATVLPQHFVLYRPKDMVSGDFYWFSHLLKEDTKAASDFTFLAAVDCTGHGVPGAFMSIIGNTLLNEIINQKHILDPAQIMEHLNQGVMDAIEKSDEVNTKGMDVCLIRLERGEANQIRMAYCGAKRPLYYVRPGEKQVSRLEADRKSIGSESKNLVAFITQELVLEEGVHVYLTSDGYVDQNNEQREKLGSDKLRELIIQATSLAVSAQKQLFETALDEHQQGVDQRDDITIIGVQL